MQYQSPSPEWAVALMDKIIPTDDQEALQALLELLAGIAPTSEEEKYKHDAALAAIDYGYRKTVDCDNACARYVGIPR
jgi:hypothetical protein